MAGTGAPVIETKAGLAPVGRLLLIVAGFITGVLYVLPAWATFYGVARAIAQGYFYRRSDFAAATWQAGFSIRAGDLAGLYHARWLYPPPMGLLAVAFSYLPLALSFWAWIGGTTLLAAALLRHAGLPWLVIIAGLLGPACFYNILLGQNGALTAGLLLPGLLMLRTRPGLAGVLAGCLCIKPQMAALLPVVLVANRRWRPVVFCLLSAAALFLAATALCGWRSWLLFLTVGQPEAHRQLVAPFGGEYQLACYSVFMMARSLGFGLSAAWALQAACAVAAVAGTWMVWRDQRADPVPRAFLTLCFAMLAVPFGFSYDLIGFSVAVAAMVPRCPPSRWPVLAALWLWPGLTILVTKQLHAELMPLAAGLGLWAARPPAAGRPGLARAAAQ